jgi:hypothetical protein
MNLCLLESGKAYPPRSLPNAARLLHAWATHLGEAPSHARTYVREVDGWCGIGDDFVMPAFPRCAALLRDGQPCGRTVAVGSAFCVHHTKLLATVDAETMRQGRTPKPRAVKKQKLHVVAESAVEDTTTAGVVAVENADPTTVRPSLAVAAAENVEQLTASLLEAAGSAVTPVWLTRRVRRLWRALACRGASPGRASEAGARAAGAAAGG